jgi:hypothetical protein
VKNGEENIGEIELKSQYKVIYALEQDIVTVFVLEITPHNY